ncbi:SemiSWEET family sugar transporter [Pseudoduganella rivuli]|nr:SemiSWEET transporter [Pseudoduganella rivuli]
MPPMPLPYWVDVLGYVAAFCTTIAFVPQVWLVWRRRSAEGVSTIMYIVLSVGIILWLTYGVLLQAWPVIIANAITLGLALAVLAMKWVFRGQMPRDDSLEVARLNR